MWKQERGDLSACEGFDWWGRGIVIQDCTKLCKKGKSLNLWRCLDIVGYKTLSKVKECNFASLYVEGDVTMTVPQMCHENWAELSKICHHNSY